MWTLMTIVVGLIIFALILIFIKIKKRADFRLAMWIYYVTLVLFSQLEYVLRYKFRLWFDGRNAILYNQFLCSYLRCFFSV